jgi:tRNA pseudouridine32 synthase/23S rRNA pseudouridine746 synthase
MHSCFIPFIVEPPASLIPGQLNNPFDTYTPEICKLAAAQLQEFIALNQSAWLHNFGTDNEKRGVAKGKMFGVLVVKNKEGKLGYLCTFSGKMADEPHPLAFVPSLFDIATNNNFISKGMEELTAIGTKIKVLEEDAATNNLQEIERLKEERKANSALLQQQLFESYNFLNIRGELKNVCAIFEATPKKIPPSGAGECAAPKLLHYAFEQNMQPLAIVEFWWGKPSNSGDKQHGEFYPACEDKCRPILEYMLGVNWK